MMLQFLLIITLAATTAVKVDLNEVAEKVKRFVPGSGILPFPPHDLNAKSVYNPTKDKCCKGSVHENYTLQSPYECCGTSIRNKATQLCCEDKIYDQKSNVLCCGAEVYNPDKSVCCDQKIADFSDGMSAREAECCGKTAYNINQQLCCYDSSRGFQAVAINKQPGDDQCCGTTTFNSNDKTCCTSYANGRPEYAVLQHEVNKTACCGLKLYDFNTALCCTDEVISTGGNRNKICCGKSVYDFESQVCCFNGGNPKVLDKTSKTQQCCGDALYDWNLQLCCNQKIIDNKNNKMECCGDDTINPNTQLCCYGINGAQPVNKRGPEDSTCCGTESYNSKKELCCYSNNQPTVVKKTKPEDNQCCGLKPYQFGKEICCENAQNTSPGLFGGGYYNHGCCGGKAYDKTTQYCCGNQIVSFSDGNAKACCGNELLYDTTTQGCCFDDPHSKFKPKVFPLSEGNACCGVTVYNYTLNQNQQCCAGKLYQSSESQGCCGDKLYDYNIEVCCGENVLKKKNGESQCCFSHVTDQDYHCLQEVYPHIVQYILLFLQKWKGDGGEILPDIPVKK